MNEIRESVILIPIFAAEELVGDLRKKYDPSATHGIPPHITVLFPFKHPEAIKFEDIEILKQIFSNCLTFEFRLDHISTFPGVVFIEPDNRERFIELTNKVVQSYPEYPPYEGKFKGMNPHLTLGHKLGDSFDECLDNAEKIKDRLPLKVKVERVDLMTSLNGEWSMLSSFNLNPAIITS